MVLTTQDKPIFIVHLEMFQRPVSIIHPSDSDAGGIPPSIKHGGAR